METSFMLLASFWGAASDWSLGCMEITKQHTLGLQLWFSGQAVDCLFLECLLLRSGRGSTLPGFFKEYLILHRELEKRAVPNLPSLLGGV